MEASIARAETRQAFGKLIGSFQEINHKIATMRMNIEVARQLIYYAAWLKDRGENCETDIAIAKLFASETAARSASDALQIHGGAGLTAGSKVERLYRDVKMCEIAEGTSEIQRMAIARSVLAE
jgi:butyryl-CoA dehydrogenase